MPTLTIRRSMAVLAFDDKGNVLRSVECRNVQCAVTLELKLTSDPAFAKQWATDGDPKPPEIKPHGHERHWRA